MNAPPLLWIHDDGHVTVDLTMEPVEARPRVLLDLTNDPMEEDRADSDSESSSEFSSVVIPAGSPDPAPRKRKYEDDLPESGPSHARWCILYHVCRTCGGPHASTNTNQPYYCISCMWRMPPASPPPPCTCNVIRHIAVEEESSSE